MADNGVRAPFRIAFDNARDPYTARNALGIPQSVLTGGGGGGGGAPVGAQYIVAATDPTLTAERVLTNTASITWDFTTPGQAKANSAAGGGNVSNSGTPTLGQYAKWTTATTIQGVSAATVLGDIGAQPLDPDLTAIAALTGTNTIYYRSAANTWTAVTIGTGLSFTGGTLANTIPAGGNVSNSGTPTVGQYAKWVTATTVQGVAPATVLSDIGAQPAGSYQPLDGDLTAISALAGTNVIYYRSAADTWSPVTISTGLSFSGGALTCTVSTAGSQPLDATLTALAAYNTNGLLTQTAADTFTGRTLAAPAAGFTITNPAGAAGNPTFVLANDLASLEAAAGTNTIYYRSGIDTWSPVVVSTGLAFSGGNLTATAGGGNVSTSGTITTGLYAKWVTATTIQSVANATVLSDIGAQPLDADLTSLAAASATGAIYYRSAANTWATVTIGANLTFTGGTLAATGSGNVSNSGTPVAGQLAEWVTATTIKGATGIHGITNGSNAAAGDVGEYADSGSLGVTASASTWTALGTISLPPGDFDVWAAATFNTTGGSFGYLSIGLVPNAGDLTPGRIVSGYAGPSGDMYAIVGPTRLNVTVGTGVSLNAYIVGASTTVNGNVYWRRRR